MVRFFDLNESAFAYHRHCLRKKEKIRSAFLTTLNYVADELLAELKKDSPELQLEYLKDKVMDRRYKIQYQLDRAQMSYGCYSEASLTAKAHYIEFSKYRKSEIQDLISKRTHD